MSRKRLSVRIPPPPADSELAALSPESFKSSEHGEYFVDDALTEGIAVNSRMNRRLKPEETPTDRTVNQYVQRTGRENIQVDNDWSSDQLPLSTATSPEKEDRPRRMTLQEGRESMQRKTLDSNSASTNQPSLESLQEMIRIWSLRVEDSEARLTDIAARVTDIEARLTDTRSLLDKEIKASLRQMHFNALQTIVNAVYRKLGVKRSRVIDPRGSPEIEGQLCEPLRFDANRNPDNHASRRPTKELLVRSKLSLELRAEILKMDELRECRNVAAHETDDRFAAALVLRKDTEPDLYRRISESFMYAYDKSLEQMAAEWKEKEGGRGK